MTIRYLFIASAIGSSLFTSCMSSREWVDDDVYVLKSVDLPTDTDITDESDYNAFVYNRQNSNAQMNYYSRPGFFPNNSWMMYSGFGMGYNSFGFGNRGFGGYYGSGFYDPFWGSGYGSSYYGYGYGYGYPGYGGYYGYGSPYYGYGYGYGGYGGGYGYGGNYGSPVYGGTATTGIHVSGPRGAIGGSYGGVRSNSSMAYKSVTAPGTTGKTAVTNTPSRRGDAAVNVVSKPVGSYEHAGRGTGTVTAGRTTSPSAATPASIRNSNARSIINGWKFFRFKTLNNFKLDISFYSAACFHNQSQW